MRPWCLPLLALIACATPPPAPDGFTVIDPATVDVRAGETVPDNGPLRQVRRLTTGGGVRRPRWSGDGTRLVFTRQGRVTVMDVTAGDTTTISPPGVHATVADFLQGDREVVYAVPGRGVFRTASDGSNDPVLVFEGDALGGLSVCRVSSRVVASFGEPPNVRVVAFEPDGSFEKVIAESTLTGDVSWSWDGIHVVACTANGLAIVPRDAGDLQTLSIDGATPTTATFYPDSDLVLAGGELEDGSTELRWTSLREPKKGRALHDPAAGGEPAFSPDGAWVAFVDGSADLHVARGKPAP